MAGDGRLMSRREAKGRGWLFFVWPGRKLTVFYLNVGGLASCAGSIEKSMMGFETFGEVQAMCLFSLFGGV
ncbi:hypothetical protein LZ32DRAFT_610494 [Colletotrichum eremochloae]|nr:hypothetical protein LZ32DRAFT_610494 [Colletotrichum eremochloae]